MSVLSEQIFLTSHSLIGSVKFEYFCINYMVKGNTHQLMHTVLQNKLDRVTTVLHEHVHTLTTGSKFRDLFLIAFLLSPCHKSNYGSRSSINSWLKMVIILTYGRNSKLPARMLKLNVMIFQTLRKIRGTLHLTHLSIFWLFFHGVSTPYQLEVIIYLAQEMFADDSDIELFPN